MSTNRKIIVAGGAGFLGSVLVPLLLSKGYFVTVLDRFFFGRESMADFFGHPNLRLVEHDTRWFPETLIKDCFGYIDLAAISNDPSGELDPQRTMEINFRARVRSAMLCKKNGVKKYILGSSCSVYGSSADLLMETGKTNPLTTYAKACLFAEKGTLKLCNEKFSPVVLRQGTLYGLSKRMRFDILLNTMTLSLYQKGEICVRGGTQWRPIVHVKDSARAFLKVLEADDVKVRGEIFNVGSTTQNFQILDLPKKIFNALDKVPQISEDELAVDVRSYRVSCDKILKTLDYQPEQTPESGAREIFQSLASKLVCDGLKTKTTEWYKYLLSQDKMVLLRRFK